MPAQKPKKPAQAPAKSKTVVKAPPAKKAPAPAAVPKAASKVIAKAPAKKPAPVASQAKVPAKVAAKPAEKPAAKALPSKLKTSASPATPAKPVKKAASVPAKKPEAIEKKPAAKVKAKDVAAEVEVKKPAKATKATKSTKATAPIEDSKTAAKKVVTGAKRGPKKKGSIAEPSIDDELAELEDDLQVEPVADNVTETGEKVKPLRMKISKAKERALMKEFGLDETVLTEAEMKQRRDRLKALIKLGKTRGYLTNGEISDHLPDKLVDAETLEVVIATLNDLGVAVYEQTPDAESLIITDNAPTGSTEEEAEEAAEAALSTVDSEFGRTTDPVRMYMREMGTVELLTREGEIEIAKRIEGGLMDMMAAISASPATIAEILRMANEIREGKVVISTVVDGFANMNEADDYVAEEDFDEFDEADDDDGKGGSKALTKKLEELKNQALERFDRITEYFEKVHKVYDKEGWGTPAYVKVQSALSEELMTIRFTAKTIEKLCDMVRGQVDDVRKKERELRRIIVDKCGYPQDNFIADFSGRDKNGKRVESQLLNLKWIEKQAAAGKSWSAVMGRNIPPVQDL